MMDIAIKEIKTEQELAAVLELCYRILGEDHSEMYGYEAWRKRLANGDPLVYGEKEGKILSAVLGREESEESLVIGFVACEEEYRRQGITRALMSYFEEIARKKKYKYITLGSQEDAFYEKCGYKVIFQIHGQNIYQKLL
ncbi:MAG: GNAT family N-acetyltransferase [Acetatifactor sp.]|nr:GNAT family N-acetyltransferase [Acetatifactor sp.]